MMGFGQRIDGVVHLSPDRTPTTGLLPGCGGCKGLWGYGQAGAATWVGPTPE